MKEREIILTTNLANFVPEEGQQFSVNGQLTPPPSIDVIRIQDALGSCVPIPSSEVIVASARQSTAEAPIKAAPVLDNTAATGEPINRAIAFSEAPSQYETTE